MLTADCNSEVYPRSEPPPAFYVIDSLLAVCSPFATVRARLNVTRPKDGVYSWPMVKPRNSGMSRQSEYGEHGKWEVTSLGKSRRHHPGNALAPAQIITPAAYDPDANNDLPMPRVAVTRA